MPEPDTNADLSDEADRIDELARALADHLDRTVVLMLPDGEEVAVEPAERRLEG